jgi:hypothetical protein
MFTRVFIAILLRALSNWAYGDEYAVITEQYTGRALNVFEVKEKVVLTPGLVVKAMSRTGTAFNGHFALIEVIDRPYDGVIWVPISVLATQRTFSPIKKWKEVKLDALAGDYLAHYHFYPNGTFSYRSYAESGRPFTIRGRLYKSKNILWAPRNPKREMMKEDIFVVSPVDICWPLGGDCSPVP